MKRMWLQIHIGGIGGWFIPTTGKLEAHIFLIDNKNLMKKLHQGFRKAR